MHSVSIELLKMENVLAHFEGRGDINGDYVGTNAWFEILHCEACFLKGQGPTAEGRAMEPFLKLVSEGKI